LPFAISTSTCRSFETIYSAVCLFLAIDPFLLGQNHTSGTTSSKGADHEADRRRIVAEAERPGTNLPEMARRYDIDLRMLRRWKREVTQQAIRFVTVEIVEAQRDEAVS
jgi:hypothetical protein